MARTIGVTAAVLTIIGAAFAAPAYASVTSLVANNQPNLREGTVYHGLNVGTFTSDTIDATHASAIVTWGDGTTSAASVCGNNGTDVGGCDRGLNKFVVFIAPSSESPIYADEGTFPISFILYDDAIQQSYQSPTATATVAESDSLAFGQPVGVAAIAGQPVTATVANVTNTFTGKPGAETPVADFTATINWGDGSGNPPGVVSGSGSSFTVSGSHTYSTAGLFSISVGVHDDSPGTAFVGGLVSYAQVVDATTTAVSTSANPGVAGDLLSLNALVSHSSGTAAPTGTVAFSDGATPLATLALSGGTASLSTSTLTVGDHTITASYSGDSNYAASSGTLTQSVTPSPLGGGVPPAITGERISPRAFRPNHGSGPGATTSSKRGARVVFQLSHAATIQFTILRATSGRRVGRSCVKRARNNRKHKRCARSVAVGSFTRAGVTGANSFHLTGRGPHGPLKRGGYMLSAIATDATGLRSKPAARPFRIIK